MTRPETDRELALMLARGEPRAVDAFYQAHFDAIYQFVFFRVGQVREDAEDVTSDTFLTAFLNVGDFEGRSTLSAWVRGIARNKCRERNKLRARRRVSRDVSIETADLSALSDLDGRDLPGRILESKEVAAAVSAALSQIPAHYKRVLLRKYVDEMTFADIASVENCSAKAVESMVQRAKTAFGRILGIVRGRKQTRSFHG